MSSVHSVIPAKGLKAQTALPATLLPDLAYTPEVARDTAQLYERVMGTRADEAYAATVALASLRLEHEGDPEGALALYERALAMRPEGVLSAQARAGAARCRRTLGESP